MCSRLFFLLLLFFALKCPHCGYIFSTSLYAWVPKRGTGESGNTSDNNETSTPQNMSPFPTEIIIIVDYTQCGNVSPASHDKIFYLCSSPAHDTNWNPLHSFLSLQFDDPSFHSSPLLQTSAMIALCSIALVLIVLISGLVIWKWVPPFFCFPFSNPQEQETTQAPTCTSPFNIVALHAVGWGCGFGRELCWIFPPCRV